jgi:hypothetical protein
VENVKAESDVAHDVHAGDQRVLKPFDHVPIHLARMSREDREVQQVVDDKQKKNRA